MLDGKSDCAAIPDDNPEKQSRMRALLSALERLQEEFRQKIGSFQSEVAPDKSSKSDC
jgi:hypothetical protein